MQPSTADTPVATNHSVDSSRMGINLSQQQQFTVSQTTQGNANMGVGQVMQNDTVPNVQTPGAAGAMTMGCASADVNSAATTGDDSQEEPSLDQRVKQFEMMQQTPTMEEQPLPKSGSNSVREGPVTTQPPPSGVNELLPSRGSNNNVPPSPQPPSPQPPSPQQQPQQRPFSPQHQEQLASVLSASFAGNDDASETPEPLNSLGLARAGSPGSLGVAEPDPIVDGATIIRSEGAINVIAPVRHSTGGGDGGTKDKSGAHTSSSAGADQGEPVPEQSFLDGHFAGGWQSNVDLPDRRQIIFSIIKVIERKRPDTNRMSQK